MTTKLEQAARQALEALEELHCSSGTVVAVKKYESATSALREALDHSGEATNMVQEPAAIANNAPNLFGQVYLTCRENGNSHEGSLAAADEAVRLHGDEAVSRQDLTLIVEQIVRG